ncbi:hypothetical protein [Bdellovibrio bacteriovorus]|uniref:hypothetical protein n=1 Tax=Bdellovibrio bacteriovorus TaxID=959 RepID=UPI0035A59165
MKSYGVQVAELAGLPATVTKRAKSLLRDIESKRVQASSQLSLLDSLTAEEPYIEAVEAVDPETARRGETMKSLMEELQKFPLMQTSPLDVMNQVAKWKEIVERV